MSHKETHISHLFFAGELVYKVKKLVKKLVMRRLPDKRMLPFLLDTGQVMPAMMRELAELLACFHTDAERVTDIDPDGYPALVQAQWRDNLADLAQASPQVLDGTFVKRWHREKISTLAQKHHIPLSAIHCMVSDDITQERLAQRASAGTDVSDGRWEIYLQQKDAFEALDDIPAADRLELDTDATLDTLVVACEKFLRTKLARH